MQKYVIIKGIYQKCFILNSNGDWKGVRRVVKREGDQTRHNITMTIMVHYIRKSNLKKTTSNIMINEMDNFNNSPDRIYINNNIASHG